jgi:cytochrome oxidase Cu insertion factor (SCO1/SenC/PrrC family)
MSESVRKSPVHLWLIAALCVAPVVASYIAYYWVIPASYTNYGDLLETKPLPRVPLQLVDGTPFELERLKGKWLLLMVDSGGCDDHCRRKLFNMRQLRLTQGKNMERIERVWLIDDGLTPVAATTGDYAGTWLVRAAGNELLKRLPAQRSLADHIYVIDPLGNLVLRYPRAAEPQRIIKDLERLLKASRIG